MPQHPLADPPRPTVGMLGTGTIAAALTTALCNFGEQRANVILSPRNHATSARLAQQFPNVTVAPTNQAVIDSADIVVLGIRPQVTAEVLSDLHFRPEQHILSLVATFRVAQLTPLVAPAHSISRAIPLPPVAERRGPLTLFTQSQVIADLLDGLGHLIRVDDEAHLDLISAVTSLMGTWFGMAGAVDTWLTAQGFPPEHARTFVADLFLNLAVAATNEPGTPFPTLTREFSTPGGLNEHAWRELERIGWPNRIQAALDLVLNRIHGRATLSTQLDH